MQKLQEPVNGELVVPLKHIDNLRFFGLGGVKHHPRPTPVLVEEERCFRVLRHKAV
jgi:hypothetical protein